MNKCWIICFALVAFLSNKLEAQDSIPNGSFERWTSRDLYDEPLQWTSSNQLSTMLNQTTVWPTTDSYQGNRALRLETADTIAGYVFSNGTVISGNLGQTIQFRGGFPVSGTPTSLSGYFKNYNSTPLSDAALVLVSFKKNGNLIGQNECLIPLSHASYTRINFTLDAMAEVPDTAFIALASSNPEHPVAGNWLQVDSLWFNGISDTIPNANFENWYTESYTDPETWLSSNLLTHLFGGGLSASPTTDAIDGRYALRLECIHSIIPDDDGMREANIGYLLPYTEDAVLGEALPSFPISVIPSAITGYYKFLPQGSDTAMIKVTLSTETNTSYEFTQFLPAAGEYTPFQVYFEYPEDPDPLTSIQVLANTSKFFDPSLEEQGTEGSVLYLDNLDMQVDCAFQNPEFAISVTQWPTCNQPLAILDAGPGWGSYLWSTGDTTQSLEHTVDRFDTLWVLVTSATNRCFYTDTLTFAPLEGCTGNSLSATNGQARMTLYPNPAQDRVYLSQVPEGRYQAQITDLSGRVVYQSNCSHATPAPLSLPVEDLPAGIYRITLAGQLLTEQFCFIKN